MGTKVKLRVEREGEQLSVILQREQMVEVLAKCQALEENVVHLKVYEFGNGTVEQSLSCLSEISSTQDIKGIILDLRDNPGGLVEEGIALADLK